MAYAKGLTYLMILAILGSSHPGFCADEAKMDQSQTPAGFPVQVENDRSSRAQNAVDARGSIELNRPVANVLPDFPDSFRGSVLTDDGTSIQVFWDSRGQKFTLQVADRQILTNRPNTIAKTTWTVDFKNGEVFKKQERCPPTSSRCEEVKVQMGKKALLYEIEDRMSKAIQLALIKSHHRNYDWTKAHNLIRMLRQIVILRRSLGRD